MKKETHYLNLCHPQNLVILTEKSLESNVFKSYHYLSIIFKVKCLKIFI